MLPRWRTLTFGIESTITILVSDLSREMWFLLVRPLSLHYFFSLSVYAFNQMQARDVIDTTKIFDFWHAFGNRRTCNLRQRVGGRILGMFRTFGELDSWTNLQLRDCMCIRNYADGCIWSRVSGTSKITCLRQIAGLMTRCRSISHVRTWDKTERCDRQWFVRLVAACFYARCWKLLHAHDFWRKSVVSLHWSPALDCAPGATILTSRDYF